MEKQELFHLHELLVEIANMTVRNHPEVESELDEEWPVTVLDPSASELYSLEDYHETGVYSFNIMDSRRGHKEALQELSESISESIDDISELDLPSSTETGFAYEENTPRITGENETNGGTEVEDAEWTVPESETVRFTPHIDERLEGIDYFTSEILRDVLNMDLDVISDGETYSGRMRKFDSSLSMFELGVDGREIIVENPEVIDVKNSDILLKTLDLSEVQDSPLAVKDYEEIDEEDYVRKVADRGGLLSLPRARPIESGHELFDGHKGVRVAREAGVETQLVYIDDLNEREAIEEFVDDHIPPYEQLQEDGSGRTWYNRENIEAAVDRTEEILGEEAYELDRLQGYLDPVHEVPEVSELLDESRVEEYVRRSLEDVLGEAPESAVERISSRYVEELEKELETVRQQVEADAHLAAGSETSETDLEVEIPGSIRSRLEPYPPESST